MTEKNGYLVDIFAAEVRERYGTPTHVVFRKFNCKKNEFDCFYKQTHLIDEKDLIIFNRASDKVVPMKIEYKTKKIRSYYHSKKINNIKQCGTCSVCNWRWKCPYFDRLIDKH